LRFRIALPRDCNIHYTKSTCLQLSLLASASSLPWGSFSELPGNQQKDLASSQEAQPRSVEHHSLVAAKEHRTEVGNAEEGQDDHTLEVGHGQVEDGHVDAHGEDNVLGAPVHAVDLEH